MLQRGSWFAWWPSQNFDWSFLNRVVWFLAVKDVIFRFNHFLYWCFHGFNWGSSYLFCAVFFTLWVVRVIGSQLWLSMEIIIDSSSVEIFWVVIFRMLIHNFSPSTWLIHVRILLFSHCVLTVHLHICLCWFLGWRWIKSASAFRLNRWHGVVFFRHRFGGWSSVSAPQWC